MVSNRVVMVALLIGVPAVILIATVFGSVPIGLHDWRMALLGEGDPIHYEVVWTHRLPRAMAAFVTGGLLALAGVLLQTLLRNPLADPYVLGVSGGVSVGGLLAMMLGLSPFFIGLFGLLGAAAVAALVIGFAARASGWDIYRVLLAGVGIASACGAFVALILTISPAGQIQGMLFWLMGDLSASRDPGWLAAILVVLTAIAFLLRTNLDALTLGTVKARLLGVAVGQTQTLALLCATIATVAAVLEAGAIGFVGIAVPHVFRLIGWHAHRSLVPFSVVGGGILLTIADTVARTVAAPIEIPVGVATAVIGVPVLLWLIARSR
ncbi:MAG: iron ABC transporter permease [Betaproteobacteria bacterium]|nr:iron ABC transporter permease [Betaproteobacteria bacterium]